ncbi:hypothetical protein AB0B07_10270 [Streptomyces sioyaensis]|uniref:hypothetical protein n=1 Tax=Streptomyces sioyaensis TaxID=67364 RepID=UPI0033E5034A
MTSMTQQTEVRHVFHGCRLGRSELDRLLNLAPEGIPAASASVSTQRDSTRYSAGTLADLVDSLHDANASGHLGTWNNLMQHAGDPGGDRKVTISIELERVVVQVSGRDATWVYGQAARLQLLLEAAGGRKPRGGFVQSLDSIKWSHLFAGLSFLVCMVAGGYVMDPDQAIAMLSFKGDRLYQSLGQVAGGAVWGVFAALALTIINRANRAILRPTSDVPSGSWWHRASHADRIALGGLIVATLALLIAAATLGKDLGGDGKPAPAKERAATAHPAQTAP